MSLISTSDLRLWMGIEEGDRQPNAKLSAIADAVQDFCDSYTNRKLEAQRYLTDPYFSYLDGHGYNYLYLPQYPVSYVSSINMDADHVFASGTLFASADFFWYPSGKVRLSSANWSFDQLTGGFYRGRRNILIDYTAGYAPVVGGTHNMAVSTYPIPLDLKQVMTEMCVQTLKEGMTAVHSPNVPEDKMTQMLSGDSFWSMVLTKYKAFDAMLGDRDE
jgi:hypothetical protein